MSEKRRIVNTELITPELLTRCLRRLKETVQGWNLSPEEAFATCVAGGAIFNAAVVLQIDPETAKLMGMNCRDLTMAMIDAERDEQELKS